jgi:ABC-type uncharacterized transport system substrate-binding protein
MRRREVIGFAGTALVAWPMVARAQAQAKMARLGYLGFGAPAASANRVEALRAGLRDLGYVEGKNLVIEFRWAGTVEQLNEAAVELARMNVDIIFATSSTESEPARRATNTIPIVFATHADPESAGHVANLARPGGNMTSRSRPPWELPWRAVLSEESRERRHRVGAVRHRWRAHVRAQRGLAPRGERRSGRG